MARTTEEYSTTPFARMLTAYMWAQTPPWTTTKLGTVLGIGRVRVGRWIYHDIVPELDTMLAIMARLGIPMSRLLDAYVEAGLPVPPLSEEEARRQAQQAQQQAQPVQQPQSPPLWPNAKVVIPATRQGHPKARTSSGEAATASQAGALNYEHAEPARQPEQHTGTSQANNDAEWNTMIEHTRQVMKAAGMSESAIEEMIRSIHTRKTTRRTSSARSAKSDQQDPQDIHPQPASK